MSHKLIHIKQQQNIYGNQTFLFGIKLRNNVFSLFKTFMIGKFANFLHLRMEIRKFYIRKIDFLAQSLTSFHLDKSNKIYIKIQKALLPTIVMTKFRKCYAHDL